MEENKSKEQNENFGRLLKEFEKAKSKEEWENIIKEVVDTEKIVILTASQRSAILQRCRNSINGTYGIKEYTPNDYDKRRAAGKPINDKK